MTPAKRAYNVSITMFFYAKSAKEAARLAQSALRSGESHNIFDVTDLNSQKTITRDLNDYEGKEVKA